MNLRVQGISTDEVIKFREGGFDASGQLAQQYVSNWLGGPCRHCLGLIAEGEMKLVLSYRPFESPQPYAETGPIFLHRDSCERYDGEKLPDWFSLLDPAVVRGYSDDHWIRYDTGNVVPGSEITSACQSILSDRSVAYVHIRSKFNCFQCRVDRVAAADE